MPSTGTEVSKINARQSLKQLPIFCYLSRDPCVWIVCWHNVLQSAHIKKGAGQNVSTQVYKPVTSRPTASSQGAGPWVLTVLWHMSPTVGMEVFTIG